MENNTDEMNATVNMQQSSTEVTSSSPTSPSSSAVLQSYQQQLQDAMLAAVNSHSLASLTPQSLIAVAAAAAAAAVAAAATANTNTTNTTQQQQQDTVLTKTDDNSNNNSIKFAAVSASTTPTTAIDHVKRESIRAANRERKKKWRIHNEERNKDNDLRCRVNKRAAKLFGPGPSEAKRKWAEDEFEKRRQKRMDKERRKNMVDTILSTGPSSPTMTTTDTAAPMVPQNTSTESQPPQSAGYYVPTAMDTAAAAKMLDFPPELQRQLLEQLNNMIAMTTASSTRPATPNFVVPQEQQQQQTAEPMDIVPEEQQQQPTQEGSENPPVAVKPDLQQEEQGLSVGGTSSSTSASNSVHSSPVQAKYDDNTSLMFKQPEEEKKPEYPMDAVLTLMQLNAGWRQ